MSKYYAVGNNVYKLYGNGDLKVCGELTDKIASLTPELTAKNVKQPVNKINFVDICNKYSIGITSSYAEGYETIGKDENGTTFYVKKIYIISTDYCENCYILDINNKLWAWGEDKDNKFGLGISGEIFISGFFEAYFGPNKVGNGRLRRLEDNFNARLELYYGTGTNKKTTRNIRSFLFLFMLTEHR